MTEHRSAALDHLRRCRAADGGRGVVRDVFGEPRFHVHVIGGTDDVLAGVLDHVPLVDADAAAETASHAALYRRERELRVGFLPVLGRRDGRTFAAPLWWGLGTIVASSRGVQVAVDPTTIELDVALLAELRDTSMSDEAAFAAELPAPPLDAASVLRAVRTLAGHIDGLNIGPTRAWPSLAPRASVRAARKDDGLRVLPGVLVHLAKRSARARGVLHDLDLLAGDDLSAPAAALLDGRVDRAPSWRDAGPMPLIASDAQADAGATVRDHALSVVVGPPGTGKSTTLAAIAWSWAAERRSVLAVARTDAAVDALERQMRALLPDAPGPLRHREAVRQPELLDRLDAWARGRTHDLQAAHAVTARAELALSVAQRELGRCVRHLDRLVHHEQALHAPELRWPRFDGVRTAWHRRRLGAMGPLWDAVEDHDIALERWLDAARTWLSARVAEGIETARAQHRTTLRRIPAAMRARTDRKRADLLSRPDLPDVLRLLPPWLSDLGTLHHAFPPTRGLFDLVVVDEATHCDLASALPALQRGTRAVVSGDPRQLRHVSFLSRDEEARFAEAAGLDMASRLRLAYRDKSLVDVALETAVDATTGLDEHHRSTAEIVAFPNRTFYGGRLGIMRARPDDADRRTLHVHVVPGRRDDGVNRREVDAVVGHLVERLRAAPTTSAAVISPFRDQVEALREAIGGALSAPELEAHDLLVDTPYGAQGQERDEVWLSFAVDADTPATTWRYLDRSDVFNVAVTRARHAQHVFTSAAPSAMPRGALLRHYLEHAEAWSSVVRPGSPTDQALADLDEALADRGWACTPAFEVGGRVLDLVATREGRVVGIDLVGPPGRTGAALSPREMRGLHRTGLAVVPIQWSLWRQDPAACVERIERAAR